MTEGTLLSACRKVIEAGMRDVQVIKHSDTRTTGVPDISVNLNVTTWLEFKYGERVKWANELQRLTCRRLMTATKRCWVVLYQPWGDVNRTCIINPLDVHDDGTFECPTNWVYSFDHGFVLKFLKMEHFR